MYMLGDEPKRGIFEKNVYIGPIDEKIKKPKKIMSMTGMKLKRK